jgi:hypothetical protein
MIIACTRWDLMVLGTGGAQTVGTRSRVAGCRPLTMLPLWQSEDAHRRSRTTSARD